jgi:hypothetical protein
MTNHAEFSFTGSPLKFDADTTGDMPLLNTPNKGGVSSVQNMLLSPTLERKFDRMDRRIDLQLEAATAAAAKENTIPAIAVVSPVKQTVTMKTQAATNSNSNIITTTKSIPGKQPSVPNTVSSTSGLKRPMRINTAVTAAPASRLKPRSRLPVFKNKY